MATTNLGLTQYLGTDTMNFLTQYNTDMDKIDTSTGALASLKTAVKTSTVGAINEVYDTTDNGWISARATLTYASASAPTFVCNTSIDLTTRISVGMKIKLTQTTTKYFFVTAITSTTITLYGGTDYVLTNTAISNVCYSMVQSPHGFPQSFNKVKTMLLTRTANEVGNQTVVLGFRPTFLKINAAMSGGASQYESVGSFDGVVQNSLFRIYSTQPNVVVIHSGVASYQATASFIDNGFILSWTVTNGIPAGTVVMLAEVY